MRVSRTRLVRGVGRLVAIALLVLLLLRLWQLWARHPIDLGRIDGAIAAAAVLTSVAAVASYGLVWPYILRRLGTDASASWITLFFKSQLGKYLPGSIWQFAGRVGLARARGVAPRLAVTSLAVEIVASSTVAAALGVLVLPARIGVLVAAGIAALSAIAWQGLRRGAFLRRLPSRLGIDTDNARAGIRAVPAAAVLYLGVWVLYGLAFWLTGAALFAVPAHELPRYIGVFALAWLVGLAAVFAPGGIGVREAVIVALLRGHLGEADAILLASASRIVLAGVDFAAAGASLALPRGHRWNPRPADAPR